MSWLAAAGSILGGLFGRSKQKVISAGENRYSDVGGIIRAAKDFGFNPLTLLQSGQAIGPTVLNQDNSAFGAGIANAFALAGDAIAVKRATAQKLNSYQNTNQRLQSKLNAVTLRSPVPGVYGVAKMPSDPQVYGDDSDAVVPVSPLAVPQNVGPSGAPPQSLQPVDTTYVTRNGEEMRVPEGVDIEDVATGWVMNKYGEFVSAVTPWASSIPSVRRAFTTRVRTAKTGPRYAEPKAVAKRGPWWLDPAFNSPAATEAMASARRRTDWPSRQPW